MCGKDSVVQSKMTISLVLQNIHYNLLNIYWPYHHNRIPLQFFLFSGFFHLCRTLVFCVGKKKWCMPQRLTLETSSQAFLKPISITNGVEVTSLLIRLFLAFCSCFLYFCLDSQEKI